MKSLIAIPCYNCQNQIKRVISSLIEKKINITNKILLIDNISNDRTTSTILDCIGTHEGFTLVQNNENYGLGGSHKIAFKYAIDNSFDYITILHGDDQATTSDLVRLQTEALNSGKTTLGSRFMTHSKRVNYQTSRVIGNSILNIIFSITLRKRIRDLGSGLNVFKVSDLKKINYLHLTNYFNFNVELLLSMNSKNINYAFSPITWIESDQVSNARNFSVATSMLKSLFLWCLNLNKTNSKLDYNFKILS